jgi:hypothetical protein
VQEVFSDLAYWERTLSQSVVQADTMDTNIAEQMADLERYQDHADPTAQDVDVRLGPAPMDDTEIALLNEWRYLVVPVVSVHVQSAKDLMITLLVATGLVDHSADGSGVRGDLNFVLKYLWRRAFALWDEQPQAHEPEGPRYKKRVCWHKRDVTNIGGHTFVTAHCGRMRPAFTVVATTPGADEQPQEVLHLYLAMGLPHAHPHQQTVLARVHNHALGACLLRAAQDLLGTPVTALSVTDVMAPEMRRGGSPEEVMQRFASLMVNLGVTQKPVLGDLGAVPRHAVEEAASAEELELAKPFLIHVLGAESVDVVASLLSCPETAPDTDTLAHDLSISPYFPVIAGLIGAFRTR